MEPLIGISLPFPPKQERNADQISNKATDWRGALDGDLLVEYGAEELASDPRQHHEEKHLLPADEVLDVGPQDHDAEEVGTQVVEVAEEDEAGQQAEIVVVVHDVVWRVLPQEEQRSLTRPKQLLRFVDAVQPEAAAEHEHVQQQPHESQRRVLRVWE